MNIVGWIVRISILALLSESVPYLSDPEEQLLLLEDSGQLTCSGSNVSWYSTADDSVSIGNSSNLTVSTAGSYYCRVANGTTLLRSCPAHVSQAEFIPPSNSEDITRSVHRTNDIILSSCQHVHSIPPPTIEWMFNNDVSLPKNTLVLPSGNLLISNFVYKNNLGRYHCIASNNFTNDKWQSPTITLERGHSSNGEAIFFQNTSLNVTATVGQSVVLECAPTGEININVTWMPMPSNSQLYNEKHGGVLRIDNVALSNEGVYNCSYIWINPHDMSSVNGSRQFHLAVKEYPKITSLTVVQDSSTAVFNCISTGHPTPRIMWHTPSGVTSVADGTTLIVTRPGPEAAGTYQCLITNDIGCDHREISFSVSSIDITTSSNTSYSSAVDTSSTDLTSSILSPTSSSSAFLTSLTSSSASIGPISSVIIHSSSSAPVGPISSVIIHSSSSAPIGPISSVISPSSSSSIGPISSVMSPSSSSSIGPISSVMSPSSSLLIGPISSVTSPSSSSSITTSTDSITSQTPSVSQVYDTTILSSSVPDSVTGIPSSVINPTSSVATSHAPSVATSYISTSTADVLTMVTSHTSSSSVASHSPVSTLIAISSQVSLTSSTTMAVSSTPSSTTMVVSSTPSSTTMVVSSTPSSTPMVVSSTLSSTAMVVSSIPSSTTMVVSSTPSSTTMVLSTSSISTTLSSTSSATPTLSPTPSAIVTVPVTMVTGIEFTWIRGDVVKVQWDLVTNEHILGYKISWDSKMIESPTAAITATNMSEYEIKLMDNVATLYIYIWTYNFAGDGPLTQTSIVRPITNLRCENTSIYSARVDWTMLAPVSKYELTTHCSRTGNIMTLQFDGEELSSEASLELESLEYDCIYAITIKPEGYNDYSLQCIILTAEPGMSIEIPKNQSFVDGFWIHWKLYNFEDIPSDMILMVLNVGSQTWEITDPLSLSEYIKLGITQERTEINITITVRNMWTMTETVVLTVQPTDPGPTDGTIEGNEENSLTWIFYIVAFGSVVVVVLLVIVGIMGLKHVQMRRREFDKITNHREKIMESLKHDSSVTNGRSVSDPPKYIVV